VAVELEHHRVVAHTGHRTEAASRDGVGSATVQPGELPSSVVDHVAITRLQSTYADAVTRRAWDEVEELFADDAVVRIDTVTREPFELRGGAEVARFVDEAVARFAFFEFVILNSHVELPSEAEPDAARARIFMCELRRDEGSLDWSAAFGVYHDRYRRSADGWRFARRDYRSITRTGAGVFPFDALANERLDPTLRLD